MKQKIEFSIGILIILLILIIPSKAFGESDVYTIESYNIDMIVNEDNTFDITETINVNFTSPKHGIYRKIPLRNTVNRLDGTSSSNSAKISNIQVSQMYTTYNEDGCKVIKIGDPNKTLTGRYTYTIRYTYGIGKDPLKDVDELYYNLVGNEWDTSINEVNFRITMPKSFDETTLGFSSGYRNSIENVDVYYTVNRNIIQGSFDTTLFAGQGLTVRLTLPEGYFVGASSNFDYLILLQIVLSIIFVIIAYILWRNHGKDNMTVETVEFYPPNNLNSADIGFIYKGYSDKKDVVSLLIYLANRGYLKIEEVENKNTIIKSKDFKITKLKEYDGKDENERTFFNELFLTKSEVSKYDLYDNFYRTINKICRNINKRENQEKIFEKSSLGKRIFILIMTIIEFIFLNDFAIFNQSDAGLSRIILILLVVMLILLCKKPKKSTIIITASVFSVVSLFHRYFEMPSIAIYTIKFIIECICFIALVVFLGIIKKRTPYGNEMLGKIRGFKKFLEVAEKPKLEQLVMENHQYFYDILPYTYVLGVSKKWMEKFEYMAIDPPSWYDGHSDFTPYAFNSFMNSTYSSISTSMTSIPSSSSSGGGSSGGGSGGGGGGAW